MLLSQVALAPQHRGTTAAGASFSTSSRPLCKRIGGIIGGPGTARAPSRSRTTTWCCSPQRPDDALRLPSLGVDSQPIGKYS